MKFILGFSVCILCSAILLFGCTGATDSQAYSHPIKISEGGLIVVELLVADSIQGRFILDTGAGIHVISNALLRRIASVPKGRFTGFRHTGERIDLEMFQIHALSIGNYRQETPIVATWSVLDSFKIDGILSLKFFERHCFTLDLIDSVIIFETSASMSAKASAGRSVPIVLHDDRGRSLDVFADFRVSDSLKLECIIDSGSPGTVLDARYLPLLGIDTTSAEVQKSARKSPFGSMETEYIASIPTLSFWDIQSSAVKNVRTVFKHRLIYDGLVGTDFLLGKRVTFDIPNRRLLLAQD